MAPPSGRTPEFPYFRKKDPLSSGTTSGQAMFRIFSPVTRLVRFCSARSGSVTSGSDTTLSGTRRSAGSTTLTVFRKSWNKTSGNTDRHLTNLPYHFLNKFVNIKIIACRQLHLYFFFSFYYFFNLSRFFRFHAKEVSFY